MYIPAAMDPRDVRLIVDHYGPTRVARLLGLGGRAPKQRVSNWRTRGIPPAVILKHGPALQRLIRQAQLAQSSREDAA